MGKTDDFIIQAKRDLARYNLFDRPDYIDLYSGIQNENMVKLFATLHYHYVALFETMNARLPTGERSEHF